MPRCKHGLHVKKNLGGDGTVTQAEFAAEQLVRRRESDREFHEADEDGDGKLTLAEIHAASTRVAMTLLDRRRPGSAASRGSWFGLPKHQQAEQIFALAPDGASHLTTDEIRKIGRKAFSALDRNGDGMISGEENETLKTLQRTVRNWAERNRARQEAARGCPLPAAPAKAQLLLLHTEKGATLSSVAVSGQDKVTSAISLVIEPGRTPLYIVAVARTPVIWHLSSHTERVARFVARSSGNRHPASPDCRRIESPTCRNSPASIISSIRTGAIWWRQRMQFRMPSTGMPSARSGNAGSCRKSPCPQAPMQLRPGRYSAAKEPCRLPV